MKIQTLWIVIIVCLTAFLVVSSCGDDEDDNDSDDDDDCEGEPDFVPGTPVDGQGVWQPMPGTSWQWQLSGDIDDSYDVEMYDIDLLDNSENTISDLQGQGKIVICYFSAGSFEDWRADANQFPSEVLGKSLEGWEGERWVDIRSSALRQIMENRLDIAVDKGCDGVEPDNVDGYSNDTGFDLTAEDQIDFNRFIADAAHERGLSVGLKNDVCQFDNLLDWFDWALNEECAAYDECDVYDTFIDANKAVFHVEYVDDFADAQDLADEVCDVKPELDTLIKEWDLGPQRVSCDD